MDDQGLEQQKRLLTTFILVMLLVLGWQYFSPRPQAPAPAPDAGAAAPTAQAPAPDAGVPGAVAGGAPETPEGAPVPEQRLEFSGPAKDLAFTNRGGGLTSAVIRNAEEFAAYKFKSRQKTEAGELAPQNMVQLRAGQPVVGATEIGGELALGADVLFETERTADGVVFRTARGPVAHEKRYTIAPDTYESRVEYRVTNRSAEPKKATLTVLYPAWVDPTHQKSGSMLSPPPEVTVVGCRHETKNTLLGLDKGEKKSESFGGPVKWAGLDERYFAGLFFPRFAEGTSCTLTTQPDGAMRAAITVDLGTIAPGQTATREFGLYLGPKSLHELARVSLENASGAGMLPVGKEPPASAELKGFDPELGESIDFGWWAVICRILLAIMRFFQTWVHNWGLAIILLTVLVKVVLYPLSVKQMASMESMRKLQPQLEALQKKYANDKEKMNLERMRLFQENKVNPLGGCLPLLIQMPVWFALYRTLQTSFELYREPLLMFWVKDLTLADPYFILPLAMGVTMFITQKMQPQMGDPTQAKIMLYFMPIFFTFLMLWLPAGLTLYIFTNNLLSIAQQKYLQHKFAAAKPAKS